MEDWMASKGVPTLREIGVKENLYVLDFGCGSGTYSILASMIVGKSGKVYALDSDEQALNELKTKLNEQQIQNVKVVKTTGVTQVPLEDASIDVVLLYDVYHLLSSEERDTILEESHRILKKGGFLSYLATHVGSYDVNLKNVHARIKKHDLELIETFRKPMFHWSWIEECQIFNYYNKS